MLSDCLFESLVIGQSVRWVGIPLWSLLETVVTKAAGVLVTGIFLVFGGPRWWWVGTGSLTKHGSWRRRLFWRWGAGVVLGGGVLVVGAVRGCGRSAFSRVEH